MRNSRTYLMRTFSAMIPKTDDVDPAWTEFEQYSTNDYIRQLLDAQVGAAANTMSMEIS